MKIIIISLVLLLTASFIYAAQTTTNYNMVIPAVGDRGWISYLSEDIISIDSIMNMMSVDLGTSSKKVKISDDHVTTTGGLVGRFRVISDDGSVCFIRVYSGK